MMRTRRKGGIIGMIVTLGVFGICMIFVLLMLLPGLQARLSGVKTVGTVQDVSDCTSDDSGGDVALGSIPFDDIQDNVQPTVQFTDRQGQSYTVEDSICGNYGIGEQVTLWYVPGNPTVFSLEDDATSLIVLALVFGVPALIALLFFLVFLVRFLFLAVVGVRAASQGNAYVASPAYAGGQFGGSAYMGAGQVSAPPQMIGGQMSGSANHRKGEAVAVDGRWVITLTDASPSQGDRLLSAAPGRYYLVLRLTLHNTSRDLLNFGQATFRLYDAVGAEYQRVHTLEGAQPGLIEPGASVTAGLAYDVPGTLRQFRLSFYPPAAFTAQANWEIAL